MCSSDLIPAAEIGFCHEIDDDPGEEDSKPGAWDVPSAAQCTSSMVDDAVVGSGDGDSSSEGLHQDRRHRCSCNGKFLETDEKFSNVARLPPMCHFFLLGHCNYGDQCRYSHELPHGGLEEARQQTPCPYFLQGNCRFGESCILRHDDKDIQELEHLQELDERNGGNAVVTCGICLDDIAVVNKHNRNSSFANTPHTMTTKKFGLLSGCDHVFCFDCLKTWRAANRKSSSQRSRSFMGVGPDDAMLETRTCPTCRAPSDFIVPSRKYCTGEEKQQVIDDYKNHLATKPCKRFDGRMGSCPFGRECFYAHLNSRGRDVKENDKPRRRHSNNYRHQRRNGDDDDMMDMYTFFLLLDLLSGQYSDSDEDGNDDDEASSSAPAGDNFDYSNFEIVD